MKTLNLHVDYIKFKPLKKALKSIGELSEKDKKEKEVKEALVVLTAVEKGDTNTASVVKELVVNVKDIASQVKTKNIVLYPYAHLSKDLGNPEMAQEILEKAEEELVKEKFKVTRAPFGYYKEFELKVKGHPLSELSREIRIDEIKGKEKENTKGEEEVVDENERLQFVKKLSKISMQTIPGKNGLKSNVELGKELDLYIVNEVVGQGLPLFTPRGATIKRELERFITDEELKRGYQYTSTPIMAKSDLYKVSGHWQHYKDSMFVLNIGDEVFALRPMTCPFQFVIYKSKPRSYRELPIKYAELSNLFRNEQSGELRGLTRVRQFTLADAHVICKLDQLEEEFEKVVDLIKYVMKTLNIEVWYRFSKWDPKNKEKYVDNHRAWDETQKAMKKILDKLKIKYVEADNEAAFYGPKLDLQYNDVYGKEDTLITVQIDFALPERFDLTYIDKDNTEKRPIVIHRSSIGCIERTMAYLLEKTQGRLPTWLSPIQVRVLSFTDRNVPYAEKMIARMKELMPNLRVDWDFDQKTVQSKVKDAEMMKVPYIIVIGDKEEKEGVVSVRKGGDKVLETLDTDKFIFDLKMKIEKRE
jgi:threonyl-tRNA synthetase